QVLRAYIFCGACGNNRTNRGGFQFAAARLPWFRGEMYIPQKFLPKSRQKLLRSAPGQSFPAVAVMPLAAKVLKKMMGAENQREEKAG
ncbi:hypothetical protein ACRWUG_22555, partial [Escherichia coli]